MGEGFVVVSINEVNLYYYMDEPGIVPLRHKDDPVEPPPPPEWGLDVKCGKGTNRVARLFKVVSIWPLWSLSRHQHQLRSVGGPATREDLQVLLPSRLPASSRHRRTEAGRET